MATPIINVLNAEYIPSIPWSRRKKNGNYFKLIGRIREFLSLLAGGEMLFMLRDLVIKDEIKIIAKEYHTALANLSEPINQVKLKNKHLFFRPLKNAQITMTELKEMKYKIGNTLWSSCKRNYPRKLGGRPKINEATQNAIKTIIEETSMPSSFRIIKVVKRPNSQNLSKFEPKKKQAKLEKNDKTVQTRTLSLTNSKQNFDKFVTIQQNLIENDIEKISFKTFYKYVQNEQIYKKPKNVS